MNAYRKRFIQLNILLVGGMLLLMLTSIGVYMAVDYYNGLCNSMRQVVRPFGDAFNRQQSSQSQNQKQPNENTPQNKNGNSPQNNKPHGQPLKLKDQKAITIIFYDPEEQSIEVLSSETGIDKVLLLGPLERIAQQEKIQGILPHDGIIYYRTGNGSPYKIAIAPIGYIGESMWRLVLILLLIWVVAMLGFYELSRFLSKLAAKPMEDAIAREKQFIADASHDLKTPLSIILANNSILRESRTSSIESQIKWIDSTEAAAKNMQQLIQEMLTLSKLEQSTAPSKIEPVDFSSVVMKAALQMESVAYEKDVELESDIAEGLILRGDVESFRRITSSLIENALKYEPPGGRVTITLAKQKKQIRLTVRNHNSVIQPEDLPHVFERFYRGDKSRQTQDSHGLGLAITKQMTECMGGKIRVESSLPNGTVFTVTFP